MATQTAWIEIAINGSKALNAINRMDRSFSKLGDTVSMAMTAITIVETIKAVGRMEELGTKVINVTNAFENLDRAGLLANLRLATKGMVDDLSLMQLAVKFENFGLPVQQMAQMMEFAQMRAAQAGESIDYMVESIIIGLGRKSIKVLDNLQINVGAFQEAVSKGATYVEALNEQMGVEMAKSATVSASSWKQIETSFTNAINNMSTIATNSGLMEFFAGMANAIDKATQGKLTPQGQGAALGRTLFDNVGGAKDLEAAANQANIMREQVAAAEATLSRMANLPRWMFGEELNDLETKVKFYTEAANELDRLIEKGLIPDTKELVEQTDEEKKAVEEAAEALLKWTRGYKEAQQAIKELNLELDNSMLGGKKNLGSTQIYGGLDDIIKGLEQIDDLRPDELLDTDFTKQIDSWERQAKVIQKASEYMDSFSNAIAQSIIYGQNFGESMVNAFKAMIAQMIAAIVQAAILAGLLQISGVGEFLGIAGSFGEVFKTVLTGTDIYTSVNRTSTRSTRTGG